MKLYIVMLSLLYTFNSMYACDESTTNRSVQIQGIIDRQAQNYLKALSAPKPEHTLCENKLCAFLTERCTTAHSLIVNPSLDRTSEWSKLDAELMKIVHLQALLHDPNARMHYYYARVVANTLTEVREVSDERMKILFTESHGGHLLVSHQLSQAILKLLSQQEAELT